MDYSSLGPAEIFRQIDSQLVSADAGIALIENYGRRKEREAVENIMKAHSEFGEIEERVAQLHIMLDRLFNAALAIGIEKRK
jgi:hypothetical protein